MGIQLRKLSEQVMVITGASSGIGLTTARMAAQRGAKLVLAARNREALQQLADELNAQGCEAIWVEADVGDEAQVRNIAQQAIARFGRFDTWVNDAGVSIFGRIEQVPLADARRLFDTNFWGVVHGSLVAVEHLKQHGGALINLGSEVSDVAVPLQGIYSASKHAVKGFTDSLRIELQKEDAPVSVTLVKPAAIDTMFVPHAKNLMEVEPRLPAPVYAPEVVAEAILFAAEHPQRDLYAGGAAKLTASGQYYTPGIMDRIMKRFMFDQQRTDQPADRARRDGLHQPGEGGKQRYGHPGTVLESSLYTKAATHPAATVAVVGAGLALAAMLRARRAGGAYRTARTGYRTAYREGEGRGMFLRPR